MGVKGYADYSHAADNKFKDKIIVDIKIRRKYKNLGENIIMKKYDKHPAIITIYNNHTFILFYWEKMLISVTTYRNSFRNTFKLCKHRICRANGICAFSLFGQVKKF